jgi:hypothetical protein
MNFWTWTIGFWIVMLGAVVVEVVWKWRQEHRPADTSQATDDNVPVAAGKPLEVEQRRGRGKESAPSGSTHGA